ncbi:MAG TPA: amidohydrolase [Bacteroidia bacterium]|nr:amidohydrolase [Bacteroidia bacterium]
MKFSSFIALLLFIVSFEACKSKTQVDFIIYNANIYTVDSNFSKQDAMAVHHGKIVAIGSAKNIFDRYDAQEKNDLKGMTVMPGLYDAHTHFYYYALGLREVDLVGTRSYNQVIERVLEFSKSTKTIWIKGRGWDQNDWKNKEFPSKDTLDLLFPNTPVFLSRIDGHAAIANQKAFDIAGVNPEMSINGGLFETKTVNGKKVLTGILVDNAVDFVSKNIPEPSRQEKLETLLEAQKNCFAVGLTSVAEAGLSKKIVEYLDSLQNVDLLKMKLYIMLTPDIDNFNYYFKNGPVFKDRLTINSFKIYADGALGSRGACLLSPYKDKKNETGFLLSSPDSLIAFAEKIANSKFQMNTHCIGDSANRFILNLYNKVLGTSTDRRWRIEHAQVINENDFQKFATNKIIPSVQPTHATSDMYWVYNRIGNERAANAYAYKKLIDNAGMIAGGSDFPVEGINPFRGIYAAVVRQDLKRIPANGFEAANKITREQAIKAFTIWAAYAGFEEKTKGSLEEGKSADFIVIDKDIMQCSEYDIPYIKVLKTFSNGKQVY